eukprot:6270160-Alexandrium_andersonii.AAC.1
MPESGSRQRSEAGRQCGAVERYLLDCASCPPQQRPGATSQTAEIQSHCQRASGEPPESIRRATAEPPESLRTAS